MDEDKREESNLSSSPIHSKAVIKYNALPLASLDLNDEKGQESFCDTEETQEMSSSWLKRNLMGKFIDHLEIEEKPLDLASFNIAEKYISAVGEVDVITDAENIKKLLKMPYSSDSGLSMAVHRIGKTLLLNELDIPSLLRNSSFQMSNFQWLKDVYCDLRNLPKEYDVFKEQKTEEQLALKAFLSKMIPKSIPYVASEDVSQTHAENFTDRQILSSIPSRDSFLSKFPDLSSGTESSFQRDIIWTFEDIRMLVGSNVPIFGGAHHPAVSVRLREFDKPINVLTGLDYWLDNLMCNVPEVLMFYHMQGIIQKYEVLKTEELPTLEGGKFNPKVVKDVAQNILSFLKSNCTKEGHTYWLFKDKQDGIVKLYDLTSVCGEGHKNSNDNPFTLPVAMLLFRVADGIINNGNLTKRDAGAARALLHNCLRLLSKEDQPDVTVSASSMLVNLYLQEEFSDEDTSSRSPESPMATASLSDDALSHSEDLSDNESNSSDDDDDATATEIGNGKLCQDKQWRLNPPKLLEVKALSVPSQYLQNEPKKEKVVATLNKEQRAREALSCIAKAFKNHPHIDDKGNKNAESETDAAGKAVVAWQPNAAFCLVKHAIKAYILLTEINLSNFKIGRALKYIRCALVCCDESLTDEEKKECMNVAVILMLLGDAFFQMSHASLEDLKVYQEDYIISHDDDLMILNACNVNAASRNIKLSTNFISTTSLIDTYIKKTDSNTEMMYMNAKSFYELSIKSAPSDFEKKTADIVFSASKRLGNVRNELGVSYMNKAAMLVRGYGDPSEEEKNLWKLSYNSLVAGIQAFQIVNDRENIALLNSNMSRLMQLTAQVIGNSTKDTSTAERSQFTEMEKIYYNKAIEYYDKAFQTLGTKETSPSIWDNVSYEISGSYYSMACTMQDHPPLGSISEDQVVKDVSSLMMKSLHYSEDLIHDETGSHYNRALLRSGEIHQRIGSLHHHLLRNQMNDNNKKKYKSLSDLHFNKAKGLLMPTKFPIKHLEVILEHCRLSTFGLKTHMPSLSIAMQLKTCLVELINSKCSLAFETLLTQHRGKHHLYSEAEIQVMRFYGESLIETMKDLLKCSLNLPKKQSSQLDSSKVKQLFEITLRGSITLCREEEHQCTKEEIEKVINNVIQILIVLRKAYESL